MNKKMIASFVAGALMMGGVAFAVSAKKHPNLAAAQKNIEAAVAKLTAAQKANEFDLDGHAAKAKDLLDQAETEVKAAAAASNENKATK